MDRRKRRAISSALGKIDRGPVHEKEVLRVDDPADFDMDNFEELPEQLPQQYRNRPVQHQVENKTMSFGSPYQEEEESIQQMEQRLRVAKNEKKIINQTAPTAAVQRLEILTGIGRLVKDITIENVKFSLRSLKNKEIRDVMKRAVDAKTHVEEVLVIRVYVLAYSVYKIDDRSIEDYIGSYDIDDKIDLINELEEHVVSRLWKVYSEMLEDHNNKIEQDLGETSEKIVDNIKKS